MSKIDLSQTKCELCRSKEKQTMNVYCNQCEHLHSLCVECIQKNILNLGIKPVKISTIFGKNIQKWR